MNSTTGACLGFSNNSSKLGLAAAAAASWGGLGGRCSFSKAVGLGCWRCMCAGRGARGNLTCRSCSSSDTRRVQQCQNGSICSQADCSQPNCADHHHQQQQHRMADWRSSTRCQLARAANRGSITGGGGGGSCSLWSPGGGGRGLGSDIMLHVAALLERDQLIVQHTASVRCGWGLLQEGRVLESRCHTQATPGPASARSCAFRP
jgi:hypothetical protein